MMTQDKETLREAVARILAPHLPGGREFDDMPKNRVQYREWAAIGKCEYNDATQEEAFDAADAAIATMFERLRTHGAAKYERLCELYFPEPPLFEEWLTAFQQENSDA